MSSQVTVQENSQAVHANATVIATGSSTFSGYSQQDVNLIINILNAPTGTTPTITFTLTEVDPGDLTTSLGNTRSGATISAAGLQFINIPLLYSSAVKVSWVVTGTTPSFTGVYVTLISKSTNEVTNPTINSTSGVIFGKVILGAATNGTLQALRGTAYTEQAANAQRSISSANAADTGAGTGAQQVTITYLNVNGAGPFTEVVTLNGTTSVATTNTNICFIEKMVVTRVGSGAHNAGVISLFVNNAGGGGTIGTIGTATLIAAVGDSQTFWSHHYVPVNKTAFIYDINGATDTGIPTFIIRSKNIVTAGSPEIQVSAFGVSTNTSGSISQRLNSPLKVIGPSRLVMYGIPSANGTVLSGGFTYSE